MTMAKTCRSCGETRDEKTGNCRHGCQQYTAQPVGSEFTVRKSSEDESESLFGGGIRRTPTNHEGER